MSEPVLHNVSKRQVDLYLQKPAHALAIVAPEGTGKLYVAQYMAKRLLGIANVDTHPYMHIVSPQKQSITINQIRELHKKLQLKVPGSGQVKQVVIIQDAQQLTHESQNALLKTLEEPPEATVFILTIHNMHDLLPTVASRITSWHLQPLNDQSMLDIANGSADEATLRKLHMSAGRVGLFHALLADETHKLTENIARAKEILAVDKYHRLLLLREIKDRQELLECIDALIIVCHAATRHSVTNKMSTSNKHWYKRLRTLQDSQTKLQKQASVKLVSTGLALNL